MPERLSQETINAIVATYEPSKGILIIASRLLRSQSIYISAPTVKRYWLQYGRKPSKIEKGGRKEIIPVESNFSAEDERFIIKVYNHSHSLPKAQRDLILYTQGEILGVLIKHGIVEGSLEYKVSH